MKIILFSGRIGSGKTTASNLILSKYKNCKKFSFATPLKDMCKEGFRPLTDQLNKIFETANLPLLKTEDKNWYQDKNFLTRHILQIVGTNIVRRIDPDYWAKYTAGAIIDDYHLNSSEDTFYILDDTRFKNEIKMMKEYSEKGFEEQPLKEVFKVQIKRPGETVNGHESENQLSDVTDWDFVIENNGSMEDLEKTLDEMLNKFGITKQGE